MQNHSFDLPDFLVYLRFKKSFLLKTLVIGFVCALLYVIFSEPLYKIEAQFKDAQKNKPGFDMEGLSLPLPDIFSKGSENPQILFSSKSIWREVASLEGLRAEVENVSGAGALMRPALHAMNALAPFLHWPDLPFFKQNTPFKITQLSCPPNFNGKIKIAFLEEDRFLCSFQGEVKEGKTGSLWSMGALSFVLEARDEFFSGIYTIKILSEEEFFKKLEKRLILEDFKKDKSIVKIQFFHSDRLRGIETVNRLMEVYQKRRQEEINLYSKEQLAFLEEHQKDLFIGLEEARLSIVNHHVGSSESGFFDAEKGLEQMARLQMELQTRKIHLSTEKRLLEEFLLQKDPDADLFLLQNSPLLSPFSSKTLHLKEKRDILLADLKRMEIEEHNKDAIETEEKNGIAPSLDYESILALFRAFGEEKEVLKRKDREINYLLPKIEEPHFQMGALAAVIETPQAHELLNRSQEIALALKETKNHSEKEQLRLQERLGVQKSALKEHLEEQLSLMAMRTQTIQEKRALLGKRALYALEEQLETSKNELFSFVEMRLNALSMEIYLIDENIQALNPEIKTLSSSWLEESLYKSKLSMMEKIHGEVLKAAEGKTIASRLDLIESKPIDYADSLFRPHPIFLFSSLLLGGMAGLSVGFAWIFFELSIKGTPLLPQLMDKRGISVFRDFPLEATVEDFSEPGSSLRKWALDVLERKKAVLIYQQAPLTLLKNLKDWYGKRGYNLSFVFFSSSGIEPLVDNKQEAFFSLGMVSKSELKNVLLSFLGKQEEKDVVLFLYQGEARVFIEEIPYGLVEDMYVFLPSKELMYIEDAFSLLKTHSKITYLMA